MSFSATTTWFVTWLNGAGSVEYADWSCLKGRAVTVLPDNDDEGRDAAKEIAKRVPGARVVELPDGLSPKWDLADPLPTNWDRSKIVRLIEAATRLQEGPAR